MRTWKSVNPSQFKHFELQLEEVKNAWDDACLVSDPDSATRLADASAALRIIAFEMTGEV